MVAAAAILLLLLLTTHNKLKLKESEMRDKNLDFARELEKLRNMKVTMKPHVIGALSSYQRIGTGIGGLGNKRTSGDHPNYSIVEIGQNTKSPGDWRRLAVVQNSSGKPLANTGVKNSQMSKIILLLHEGDGDTNCNGPQECWKSEDELRAS